MDIDLTGNRGNAPPPGGYGLPPGMGPGGMRPRRPASPLRILMSLFGSFAMLPMFFFIFAGAPSCMGFEEPTLRLVEACPPAAAALGTPITRSWIGMSCGNAEEEGAFGHATWTFPVAGPNGRGSVSVVAMRSGGPWIVQSASVETSAGTFEAVSCAAGAGVTAMGGPPLPVPPSSGPPIPTMPSLPGMPMLGGGAPIHLTATIANATPGAPATDGESCAIDVTPAGFGAPCPLTITCGGRSLYGGAPHATCLPGARGGTTALDTNEADGDAIVTITSESGTGTMTSTNPVWSLTFSFAPAP